MFGGVRVKDKRGLCSIEKIEVLPPQKFVKIDCLKSNVCAKVGDNVKQGTLIASFVDGKNPNIFASISGKIIEIKNNEITIENNFKNEQIKFESLKRPTKEQIISRIKQAGIVGLGGAGYCTHLKYENKNNLHTLLINAVECENYLNCDETVLKVKTKEVFEGIKFLQKASGAKRVILCLQKRCKKHLVFLKKYLNDYNFEVAFVTNKYGVGAERVLIKEVLKVKIKNNEIPSDKGIVMNNLQTAWAVFRCCKLGLPLTQRVVSITGLSIKNPANYMVNNGSVVENICENAGGLKYDYIQMEDYKYSALILMQEIETLKDKIRNCKVAEDKQELWKKLNVVRAKLNIDILAKRKEKLKQYRLCLSKIVLGGIFMGKSIDDIEDSVKITDGGVLFLSNLERKK